MLRLLLLSLAGAASLLAASAALLAAQAAYVSHTVPILPPARGVKQGVVRRTAASQGSQQRRQRAQRLRLVMLGDSVVEGIGVDSTLDALPHQLAVALADSLARDGADCEVRWLMLGKTGYCASHMLALVDQIPAAFTHAEPDSQTAAAERSSRHASCDEDETALCVLSVGVNHIVRFHSRHRFETELFALIAALRRRFQQPVPVFLCGMPPMNAFPLPFPLRDILGLRAAAMDASLHSIEHSLPDVCHISALQLFTPAALTAEGVRAMPPEVAQALTTMYEEKGWKRTAKAAVGFPTDASLLFRDQLARDGYHPNAYGCKIMASIAVLVLLRWLRRRRGEEEMTR
jgi:lysophospholipase L1-like esterase